VEHHDDASLTRALQVGAHATVVAKIDALHDRVLEIGAAYARSVSVFVGDARYVPKLVPRSDAPAMLQLRRSAS
jgi:hypothetical protein